MPAPRIGTLKTKGFGVSRLSRSGFAAVLACVVLASAWGGGINFARADDCNGDIAVMSKKRQAIIDELNKMAKAAPKGQLDPTASCPKLRSLAAVEQQLLAYLKKNKDWCSVPDDAVNNFASASEKSKSIAAKACAVAEQIKKGLQSQAAQAPKLPTGPL